MLIECPNCHRKGEIPDRFGLSPHFVRCRTCLTRFTTIPLDSIKEIDHSLSLREQVGTERTVGDSRRSVAAETRDDDDFDDSDIVSEVRGPGDSHYEWPGIEAPDPDDSQVELPAFTDDEDSASGEVHAYADSASEEMSVIDFGDNLRTRSHARFRHAATLFLRAGLLAIVCFFVYEAGRNSHTAGSSLTAYAAVSLGLVGLLLLDHELRGLIFRLVALPPRKPGLRARPQRQTAR